MYKIVKKKSLNPTVTLMEIDAPLIAKKAEPGQFIMAVPLSALQAQITAPSASPFRASPTCGRASP